jgi:hypothetical protein
MVILQWRETCSCAAMNEQLCYKKSVYLYILMQYLLFLRMQLRFNLLRTLHTYAGHRCAGI